jgi:hypothetical protein
MAGYAAYPTGVTENSIVRAANSAFIVKVFTADRGRSKHLGDTGRMANSAVAQTSGFVTSSKS